MDDHTGLPAHAILGASSAKRWMNCPGSVALIAQLPDEDHTSPWAREGTAAHEVAEKCLLSGLDPEFYVGQRIEGIKVTKDMAAAVREYTTKVRAVAEAVQKDIEEGNVELRVTLDDLDPPEPMFGTADFAMYDELRGKHLWIIDYKHGQGVAVEAERNEQLMYYALGAVLTMKVKPRKITVVIVQPRAAHSDGIVRDYTFDWEELVAFKDELMVAAYATQEPDAPLVVGDWCRFCPAKPMCPAQYDLAIETAQDEFSSLPVVYDEGGTEALPAPMLMTFEDLQLVMDKADAVMDWLRSVQRYVQEELEAGQSFEGWKLVEKRANRKWKDEDEVADFALDLPGVEPDDLFSKKLLSPRQMELMLKRHGHEMPDHFTDRTPSGYNLVREEDPRPAAIPAGHEFTTTGD